MSPWAGLLGTRGCEEQEAKGCAGSAIDRAVGETGGGSVPDIQSVQ